MTNKTKENITQSLAKLEQIIKWFENQNSVDVEEGLEKVKEGAVLVKQLRLRLRAVENEFLELKKELDDEENS